MEGEFPLSLPQGASAVRLPWGEHGARGFGGDRGWIVEANTGSAPAATWRFGKTAFGRHFCLHRFKLWWLKPSHGYSGLDIPPETSMLLAERHPNPDSSSQQYVALLPLSDTHASATLHRAGDGGLPGEDPSALALSASTGDPATSLPGTLGVLLLAVGSDPFRLVRRLVEEAAGRLRTQLGLEDGGVRAVERTAAVAGFVDKFGWCTWDSFYTMVTAEGVLKGLTTLHEGGVRPRWVVIDDGWQRTTNDDALNTEQWDERLVGLEANKRFRRFDEQGKQILDLGDTVRKMKRDFGVDQVLAWHAMAGYWAGVEPEATEMKRFSPGVTKLLAPKGIREADPKMQPELDEKRFGMIPSSSIEDFYLRYHRYLKDNGIDGVKVDAQSILDCMGGGNGGVPAVTRAYHEGLGRSVQGTFKEGEGPAALIHCMCHAPSVLFHIACLSQDRAIIRGSDDFYPGDDSSHGQHLYTNAYNAVFLSTLGLQDWDMFQTGLGLESTEGPSHKHAEAVFEKSTASWFHAAARAISGGPVYVSDRPGQHDTDILAKLVLDDGSVLRASTNALPTLDCLMRCPQAQDGGLLQIWALNAVPGTGVVGSFNVQSLCFSESGGTVGGLEGADASAVHGTVAPSDVHAFLEGNPIYRPPAIPEGGALRGVDDEGGLEDLYAVFLHCRRETRVVTLRQAVQIELLPLAFELATFSRVVELVPPSPPGDSRHPSTAGHGGEPVLWAFLGLSDMFNSGAAVTRQDVKMFGDVESVPSGEEAAQGKGGGGAGITRVALSIKGSGRFLAVASRQPTRATLGSAGIGIGVDSSQGKNAAGGLGVGDEGADAAVVLEVSFSTLSEPRMSGGGEVMGLVEVHIPGPWDGREKCLVFSWD